MTFPRRLLNEGEEIALDLKPHWWYFARPIGYGLVLVALLVGILQLPGGDDVRQVAWWIYSVLAVAWVVYLLVELLRWWNTHFVVTSDRLIYRTGVLSRQGREIPLERVNDISFHQSLWERMLKSGDLLIESAGEQGQQRFHNIPHADFVHQEIYRQMEANQRRDASYAGGGAQPPVTEQLAQLADLHERGVLSDEEFERGKQQLLGRL